MKRVTLTFSMDFPDELDDSRCIQSAIEVVSQDRNWPADNDITVEFVPGEAE